MSRPPESRSIYFNTRMNEPPYKYRPTNPTFIPYRKRVA